MSAKRPANHGASRRRAHPIAVVADGDDHLDRQILDKVLAAIRAVLVLYTASLENGTEFRPSTRHLAPAEWHRFANLAQGLQLSAFEQDVLLLCMGVELEPALFRLIAEANRDPLAIRPSFQLAFILFPDGHWSALSALGALRSYKLIEVLPGNSIATSPLRLEERLLQCLTSEPGREEDLHRLLKTMLPGATSVAQKETAIRLVDEWKKASANGFSLWVEGSDEAHTDAIAAEVAPQFGCKVYLLAATLLPKTLPEIERLAVLWQRESRIERCLLLLDMRQSTRPDADEEGPADSARSMLQTRFIELAGEFTIILGSPSASLRLPVLRFYIAAPSHTETLAAWSQAADGRLSVEAIGRLVMQFNVPHAQLAPTLELALGETSKYPSKAEAERMAWEFCRLQSRSSQSKTASAASWESLTLPSVPLAQLKEIGSQMRNRARVLGEWGFRERERATGLSALFVGASGTGKTTAAAVLATDLGIDIIHVDLSDTVSKWIGETEKNLRRLFDDAERSGSMLLFDEADAIFGKRTSIRDSNDWHSNQQVSYLLQRLETFSGLCILTSNLPDLIDTAFLRRFRFVVHFPFPEAASRELMWQRAFPAATPTQNLDYSRLARLTVSGGVLRNIALSAAFLAAQKGSAVGYAHLLQAARTELGKENRPFPEAEVKSWT